MNKISSNILRLVIAIIGVGVLALCLFMLPPFVNSFVKLIPNYAYLEYAILTDLSLTTIPFFFALFQGLKLLRYIDKSVAFSNLSVKALKNIKYSAVVISILYGVMMPVIFLAADADDAPGLILFGMAFVFAPIVVATFAAILQRLLQEAINIKLENDLTV